MSMPLQPPNKGVQMPRHLDSCMGASPADLARVQAGAPGYFRTVAQVQAAMHELAAKYPSLVQVVKVGESHEKRDILALKITSGKNPAESPRVLHFGGEHAREIANPEVLMKWAEWLLSNYGTDATATGLADSREIWIVPIMNTDGHVVVEKGFTGEAGGNKMQRKNTVPPRGTDNNRNYPHSKWGGPGASGSPSSDTYRGASAGSDPETQAIVKLVEKIKPTVMIDWHSYSRLNLYPWGWTREPTKDNAAFKKIAEKFTTFNGYKPQPSIDLYATSGTSIDWAYEAHNVAAIWVE